MPWCPPPRYGAAGTILQLQEKALEKKAYPWSCRNEKLGWQFIGHAKAPAKEPVIGSGGGFAFANLQVSSQPNGTRCEKLSAKMMQVEIFFPRK